MDNVKKYNRCIKNETKLSYFSNSPFTPLTLASDIEKPTGDIFIKNKRFKAKKA